MISCIVKNSIQNVGVTSQAVSNGIIQCGAPKIAKLVYNSNNYDLWYL